MVQGSIHHIERDFQEAVRGASAEIEEIEWVAVGVTKAEMLGKA